MAVLMNRKLDIIKFGILIGEGSSRKAYKMGKRVYKIPFSPEGVQQTLQEQYIYEKIDNKFKCFFPDPIFLPQKIVSMREVIFLDEIIGSWTDTPIEEIIQYGLVSENHIREFFKFIIAFQKIGQSIEELLFNGGNLGVYNRHIQIVDWGIKI